MPAFVFGADAGRNMSDLCVCVYSLDVAIGATAYHQTWSHYSWHHYLSTHTLTMSTQPEICDSVMTNLHDKTVAFLEMCHDGQCMYLCMYVSIYLSYCIF